ncbi:hypothetical protein GWI33_004091 [Rhynchophorus ferrugineus]|uniref:Uncharacterized protein n=1 Tax=Rhynchophorus ferrugineus TaxID=354439 RepID=A0A834IPX7_RHYFE|nr:hypothetical protein GWI33_004091 [Rhynchophorus ferrugineus]
MAVVVVVEAVDGDAPSTTRGVFFGRYRARDESWGRRGWLSAGVGVKGRVASGQGREGASMVVPIELKRGICR